MDEEWLCMGDVLVSCQQAHIQRVKLYQKKNCKNDQLTSVGLVCFHHWGVSSQVVIKWQDAFKIGTIDAIQRLQECSDACEINLLAKIQTKLQKEYNIPRLFLSLYD